MKSTLGWILVAAVTLPASYLLARGLMRGVVRILGADKPRPGC